jgi:S1-C subfamily serine protease
MRWSVWIAGLAAGAALISTGSAEARPMTPAQIVKKWGGAVVTVVTTNGNGTGFFDSFGFLYTSYHLLDGCDRATIACPDGTKANALTVVCANKSLDLAVLWTDASGTNRGPSCEAAPTVSPGDAFVVIGSPQDQQHTVTQGIVSAKRANGDTTLFQLSAGVPPECGGSPVFNDHGDVVGMVVSLLKDGDNLAFALTGNELRPGFGVPLATVFTAPAATAAATDVTPDEATLEALRMVQHDDATSQALGNCPDVAMMVQFDGPNDTGVTVADVQRWCESEITRSAPALHLISMSDLNARSKSPWAQSAMTTLSNFDASRRCLHVSILAAPNRSVAVLLDRAAITPTGLIGTQPYSDYTPYSLDGGNAPAALEKCVRQMIRNFAVAWAAANTPVSPATQPPAAAVSTASAAAAAAPVTPQ